MLIVRWLIVADDATGFLPLSLVWAGGRCETIFTGCRGRLRATSSGQGCRSLLSIGGDEPRPRFCSGEQIKWRTKKKFFTKKGTLFSPNSGEDQKKRSSPKMEHFFSPEFKWTPTLKCTPESNYLGGDADVDHTQTIGGIYPPGFRHPCVRVTNFAASSGKGASRLRLTGSTAQHMSCMVCWLKRHCFQIFVSSWLIVEDDATYVSHSWIILFNQPIFEFRWYL